MHISVYQPTVGNGYKSGKGWNNLKKGIQKPISISTNSALKKLKKTPIQNKLLV